MDTFTTTVLIGIGATATTDAWALARRALFGMPPPDYGLVGRWLAWMARGRFVHAPIGATPAIAGEGFIGWTMHYLIGIAYAALLPLLWGAAWLREPQLLPALVVGIGTVLAPFLLMQPGMGAGLFARRATHPGKARLHSLLMHTMFGLGLCASAWLVRPFLEV